MYHIRQTEQFSKWLQSIKASTSKARLLARLAKARSGNLGDVASVGEGVFEMREHFGAGFRMYYIQRGDTLIVMLGGGDKSNQQRDITNARALAKEIED